MKEVEIKTDTTTGRHRGRLLQSLSLCSPLILIGFGFVTFTKSEEAEDACRIHFFSLRGKDVRDVLLMYSLLWFVCAD